MRHAEKIGKAAAKPAAKAAPKTAAKAAAKAVAKSAASAASPSTPARFDNRLSALDSLACTAEEMAG